MNNRDNTWEIMQIVSDFNEEVKNIDEFSEEYNKLEELYAQALRIQCNRDYGYVMTLDMFIKNVKCGGFTDYDGGGRFLDFNGNGHEDVRCDASFLKKYKGKYPFVVWFNK